MPVELLDDLISELARLKGTRTDYGDRDGFFHAIADDPYENTHPLVFADWHEDNGRPAHAQVIREHVNRGNGSLTPRDNYFSAMRGGDDGNAPWHTAVLASRHGDQDWHVYLAHNDDQDSASRKLAWRAEPRSREDAIALVRQLVMEAGGKAEDDSGGLIRDANAQSLQNDFVGQHERNYREWWGDQPQESQEDIPQEPEDDSQYPDEQLSRYAHTPPQTDEHGWLVQDENDPWELKTWKSLSSNPNRVQLHTLRPKFFGQVGDGTWGWDAYPDYPQYVPVPDGRQAVADHLGIPHDDPDFDAKAEALHHDNHGGRELTPAERKLMGIDPPDTEQDWRPNDLIPEDHYADHTSHTDYAGGEDQNDLRRVASEEATLLSEAAMDQAHGTWFADTAGDAHDSSYRAWEHAKRGRSDKSALLHDRAAKFHRRIAKKTIGGEEDIAEAHFAAAEANELAAKLHRGEGHAPEQDWRPDQMLPEDQMYSAYSDMPGKPDHELQVPGEWNPRPGQAPPSFPDGDEPTDYSRSNLVALMKAARENPYEDTVHGMLADELEEDHLDSPIPHLIRRNFGLGGVERHENNWHDPFYNSYDGTHPYTAYLGTHGPFDLHLGHEGSPGQTQKWVVRAVSRLPGSRDSAYNFEFPHEEAHLIPQMFPQAARFLTPEPLTGQMWEPRQAQLHRQSEADSFNDMMDERERHHASHELGDAFEQDDQDLEDDY